ncbi:hypothetical protein [Amycolatopsis aidingensis]|uniref:hypothetical protein n=1 Tax=Amycolatopsis aidingensis TaxID=2842453 RepID=UPI001C0E1A11|nr:hypothetical protein [Amycolatopsis aidingensis]
MFDDDELRTTLRRIGEDYQPAPAEEMLDAILTRGRRRLRYQRWGAAAAVIALVGGLGAGITMLRPDGPGGAERIPAASGLQRDEPQPGVLPGWQVVDDRACRTREEQPPPASGITTHEMELGGSGELSSVITTAEFQSLVQRVLPDTRLEVAYEKRSGLEPTGLAEVVLDPAPRNRTALVGLRASRSFDDAETEADRQLVCGSQRLRLSSDAVLQLGPEVPNYGPGHRTLEIYRTGAPTYRLWAVNALSTEQLAELGRMLATRR